MRNKKPLKLTLQIDIWEEVHFPEAACRFISFADLTPLISIWILPCNSSVLFIPKPFS